MPQQFNNAIFSGYAFDINLGVISPKISTATVIDAVATNAEIFSDAINFAKNKVERVDAERLTMTFSTPLNGMNIVPFEGTYEENEVEVVFNYRDEFKDIVSFLEKHQNRLRLEVG